MDARGVSAAALWLQRCLDVLLVLKKTPAWPALAAQPLAAGQQLADFYGLLLWSWR